MSEAGDLRPGDYLLLSGQVWRVLSSQHHKRAAEEAVVRVRLRNMETGATVERTFRPHEDLEPPDLQRVQAQFLYRDGGNLVFMNSETFEQFHLPEENLGGRARFLKEGMEIQAVFHDGRLLDAELPTFVILEVTQTEPGLKGDTATSATKPATLETGAVIQVPLFVRTGEKLKVDTRTGEYVERI